MTPRPLPPSPLAVSGGGSGLAAGAHTGTVCPVLQVLTAAASIHALSAELAATQRDLLSSVFNSSPHRPHPIFTGRIYAEPNDRADARDLTLSVPPRAAWVSPSEFQGGEMELHSGQRSQDCNSLLWRAGSENPGRKKRKRRPSPGGAGRRSEETGENKGSLSELEPR